MNAEEVFASLLERGVVLDTDGARIGITPSGVLTDVDRSSIRNYKLDLIKLLSDPKALAALVANVCGRNGIDVQEFLDCNPTLQAAFEKASDAPLPPAGSIIETCGAFSVFLRIDSATGDLVVGKAGARAEEPTQPWQSLLMAIEAHRHAVIELVRTGWTLKTGFPTKINF
jgi:hypothetical protein